DLRVLCCRTQLPISVQIYSLSILHFGRISKFQLQPSVKRSNFSAESSPSIRTPLDSTFLALKKYLPVRGETAVLVLLCIQKFRRKQLDGGAECAIESQSSSKVSVALVIKRNRTGDGALKGIQRTLKLQHRRF